MDAKTPWREHVAERESARCVGCGVIGPEFAQRTAHDAARRPTPRDRVCPGCYGKGWRLHAPQEVNL